jgi:copper chaperone CopZ
VEAALVKVEGVSKVSADKDKGTAVVTYDPSKTKPEDIAKYLGDNTKFSASVQ